MSNDTIKNLTAALSELTVVLNSMKGHFGQTPLKQLHRKW